MLPELLDPLEEPVPELVPEEELPDEEPELEDPDDEPPDDPLPPGVRSPMPTIALHAEAPAITPSAPTTKKARCIVRHLITRCSVPTLRPAPDRGVRRLR